MRGERTLTTTKGAGCQFAVSYGMEGREREKEEEEG